MGNRTPSEGQPPARATSSSDRYRIETSEETAPGAGNVIAYNTSDGVAVPDSRFSACGNDFSGHGNSILGNSIHSNGSLTVSDNNLGIDLGSSAASTGAFGIEVTLNDVRDPDCGGNNKQNVPDLTSATSVSGSTAVVGTLNSTPNTGFRIEFFANSVLDPSGHGEGEKFLGSTKVRTDANGDVSFTAILPVKVPASQRFITATATSQISDTSEFSGGVEVPVADLSLTKSDAPDPVTVGQDVTYTLTITNNGPADSTGATVIDNLPAGVVFVLASAGCAEVAGTVKCTLVPLANGASTTVTITVTPTAAGDITNTAAVIGNEPDPDTTNDKDKEVTTVEEPQLGGTVTRTQGFWSTHFELASQVWLEIAPADGIVGSKKMGDGANDIDEMLGGFWSNIAKKANGKGKAAKRSSLDQARMQLVQQLLAAMLNKQAFGTNDDGLIATGKAAFAGTDRSAILSAAGALAAFNEGGDEEPLPEGVDPGKANPKTAQKKADREFWDALP